VVTARTKTARHFDTKAPALYNCVNDDIDRLYASRQNGGHGLLSVQDTVFHEQHSLLANSEESFLQAVSQCTERSSLLESPLNLTLSQPYGALVL